MRVLHPNILSFGEFTLATVLVVMSFLKILTPLHITGNLRFKQIQARAKIVA